MTNRCAPIRLGLRLGLVFVGIVAIALLSGTAEAGAEPSESDVLRRALSRGLVIPVPLSSLEGETDDPTGEDPIRYLLSRSADDGVASDLVYSQRFSRTASPTPPDGAREADAGFTIFEPLDPIPEAILWSRDRSRLEIALVSRGGAPLDLLVESDVGALEPGFFADDESWVRIHVLERRADATIAIDLEFSQTVAGGEESGRLRLELEPGADDPSFVDDTSARAPFVAASESERAGARPGGLVASLAALGPEATGFIPGAFDDRPVVSPEEARRLVARDRAALERRRSRDETPPDRDRRPDPRGDRDTLPAPDPRGDRDAPPAPDPSRNPTDPERPIAPRSADPAAAGSLAARDRVGAANGAPGRSTSQGAFPSAASNSSQPGGPGGGGGLGAAPRSVVAEDSEPREDRRENTRAPGLDAERLRDETRASASVTTRRVDDALRPEAPSDPHASSAATSRRRRLDPAGVAAPAPRAREASPADSSNVPSVPNRRGATHGSERRTSVDAPALRRDTGSIGGEATLDRAEDEASALPRIHDWLRDTLRELSRIANETLSWLRGGR